MKTYKEFGFESIIEYVLEKDGVQFTVGLLDLANPDTDGATYLGCSVIQNTEIANYKKQIDTSIDIFSPKNIHNKPITPAPTQRFLRRALPITKNSKWEPSQAFVNESLVAEVINNTITEYYFYNNVNNPLISEIENTTSPTERIIRLTGLPFFDSDWYDNGFAEGAKFPYLKARFFLSSLKIKISNFDFQQIGISILGDGYAETTMHIRWGFDIINPIGNINVFSAHLDDDDHNIVSVSGDWEFTIENIPAGAMLWIFFKTKVRQSRDSGLASQRIFQAITSISNYTLEIEAVSTSLDTVISGVRYIDVLKQCSKFIDNLPVDAPVFDDGGNHYDNICYNRGLLSVSTSNSIELINENAPPGNYIGEVVNNISDLHLEKGMYFWNNIRWISISSPDIVEFSLVSDNYPPGNYEGELRYNKNPDLLFGLVYWNNVSWINLQALRPFVTSIKDAYETAMTMEICSDYEIRKDKIIFREFPEFYKDVEIGNFSMDSSKGYTEEWNERFKINNLKFGYETFETNRLSKNTANDAHTESEWNIPNKQVENKFERSVKYIRSAYSAQAMVDLETNEPATADDNDDEVFINSIAPLPANTFCEFRTSLTMIVRDGKLLLYNKDSNTDDGNTIINWNTRGLEVNQSFQIVSGENSGNYTVVSITKDVLTLHPNGFSPGFSGDAVIKIKYQYLNVYWQTKTNQGFSSVSGINNPDNYPNLDYSIKRNILNWKSYLKTACTFHQNGTISNLYFKNNPELKTKKTGEYSLLSERGEISIADLGTPILTPKILNVEVYAEFVEVLELLEKYENEDDFGMGYVTCYDLEGKKKSGYMQELDYHWKTGKLTLKLEERNKAENFKIFGSPFGIPFK